ncbi:restriction endonuclease subunit S [Gallalistipes aquisgranensis]|uniref:restriction endonuclease subunit S n=1 Tax=Gallalistipes aquisgranensis TaxID=2779358 RepID=UPI001CF840D0|nr:restriction endonuclease subunit S [Gallalistipes aquisgranensis]MBE5034614.1 restriction endonuclease subunit S [Gallalistipes aquisgranensis]
MKVYFTFSSALTDQLYSGQLRFHEFADDWGVSTFGHLTEHFSHRNRNSKHYPVFSVTKDTGFIPQEEQFESREIAGDDISSYKIIRQGEFAYNPARINVGSIARYDNETPCLISSLYVCIKPAADIDSDWLLYLLKSKRAIFYYNLYGEGGVRIYLFYPNFSRIKVKVPSIQEQHRIAALLKYIADKILQEKKLKDLYITQKQFLLQRMFI